MRQFAVVVMPAVLTLASVVSAENSEMVWPKNKVTLSESYLPAVAQVLTYLLFKIEELESPPEPTGEVPTIVLPPASSTAMPPPGQPTLHTVVNDEWEMELRQSFPGQVVTLGLPMRPSVTDVLLGRLRDLLANEAKRQGFAKFQGFSQTVLEVLAKSSEGTSEEQLRTLLTLMLKHNNAKRRGSLRQSAIVLEQLNKPTGVLQKVLHNIQPLQYYL